MEHRSREGKEVRKADAVLGGVFGINKRFSYLNATTASKRHRLLTLPFELHVCTELAPFDEVITSGFLLASCKRGCTLPEDLLFLEFDRI